MTSVATAGPAFLLQKGDGGGPETFTTVLEVLDIKGPSQKTDTHDVTNQSSPGATEELVLGIIRTGEITCDVNWSPTHATHNTATGIYGDFQNRRKKNWKILWPDGSTLATFAAYVTGIDPTMPVNGVAKAALVLKITGAVTFP